MDVTVEEHLDTNAVDEVAEFLRKVPHACYLQSPDWPQLCPGRADHSHLFLRAKSNSELVGFAVARLSRLAAGYKLAFLRRGPVTRTVDDLIDVVPAMARALRPMGVASMVLNPRWEEDAASLATERLIEIGAKMLPDADQSLHRATLLIDLTDGSDAALAKMKQRGRRQIKKAQKMGLEVRQAETLEEARLVEPLIESFYQERKLSLENLPSMEAQFEMTRQNGAILLGTLAGELVCAHTVIGDGNHAFWLTMVSRDEPRDLPKNYALIWEALRVAERDGFVAYDMAGTPSRYLADRATAEEMSKRNQFKTAFDPRTVELTPMMSFPVSQPAHTILFGARQKLRAWRRSNRNTS